MPTLFRSQREATSLLKQAERSVRILRTISWPPEVRERFFAAGARELPEVSYPAFDAIPSVELVETARGSLPDVPTLDAWLNRVADSVEAGARMLA